MAVVLPKIELLQFSSQAEKINLVPATVQSILSDVGFLCEPAIEEYKDL